MGQRIESFNKPIPTSNGQWQLLFTWYEGTRDTVINQSLALSILVTDTYLSVAQGLYDLFRSSWSSDNAHIVSEIYIEDTTNYGADVMRKATLIGNECVLHMDSFVNLKIQNQTLASTGASGDDDATNVENNPVQGKLYHSMFSGFIPKYRPTTQSSWTGFISDRETGILSAVAANNAPLETKNLLLQRFLKIVT